MPGITARRSSLASQSSSSTRRRLFLEQLDQRAMFAGVTGFLYWGGLYLEGTNQDDVIEIRMQGDRIEIPGAQIFEETGDLRTSIPRQNIYFISVFGYGGNDQLL